MRRPLSPMVGLAVCLAAWCVPLLAAEIHVSSNGKDTNPGTAAQPLATPAAARDAVRKLTAGAEPQEPITVLFSAGTYRLTEPWVFKPEDSGSAKNPIVYRAAAPGKVVLSGGRPITGWKKGRDALWQAEVPAVREGQWYFHQLFVNDQRAVRARTPNDGYLRTQGTVVPYKRDRNLIKGIKEIRNAFKFTPGDLNPNWHNLQDVNVYLYHSWTNSLHWLESIDVQQSIAQLTNQSGWPLSWWEKEQRYYVDNVREALDAPGEWYLDRKTGLLEYWPRPGEDMTKAEVIAPAISQIVSVDAPYLDGQIVHDLTFDGLRFLHADWSFPDKSQTLDGQSGGFLSAAVVANGAQRLAFQNCEIAHVGAYGIFLQAGCKHNRIVQCEIHDLGAGGVRIGETSQGAAKINAKDAGLTFEGTAPRDTGHNTLDNCFVHDGGHIFAAGTGVFLGHTAFNQLTHNEVCDFFYSGFCVGWVWGFGPSVAHHNQITDNHIHHLGWGVLSDMGGVYTLGIQPGTVVAHNYVHHVCSYSYGGWGLYTDEGSSQIVLENNLVHDTKSGGFHQHYGADNLVRNNIFAFSRESQIRRSREDKKCSFVFERNLVYCDNDQILTQVWRNGDYKVDYNLYWSTAKATPLFDQRDFEEWRQTSGQDQHSLLADPLFVDPAQRDFRLQPQSPAAKVGFKPFPLTGFGLYGDPQWVARPNQVTRKEFILPETAQPVPDSLADDFEQTALGALATGPKTSGESGNATIRVTDATAAGGKHALKFVDEADLAQSFHPMIEYKLNCRQGACRGSFDFRHEAGFLFSYEWRDSARPYHTGPALRIEPNGDVKVGKNKLLTVPAGQWVHFDLVCGLGRAATGTYDLEITLPGQKPQRFAGLACGKDFNRLQNLLLIAAGTKPGVAYVDNLRITPEK